MKKDIALLYELGTLRFINRTWKHFLNADVANLSEHHFRVAWLGLVLARYEKADERKVLMMCLVHDVAESRTGDTHYISRQYVTQNDGGAIKDIFEGTVFDEEMNALFDEIKQRKTLEAQIVKDADMLDVELELKEQAAMGHSIGTLWNNQRRKVIYPKLFTKTARNFWRMIRTSSPHEWHLNGKNRFNAGDWQEKKRKA